MKEKTNSLAIASWRPLRWNLSFITGVDVTFLDSNSSLYPAVRLSALAGFLTAISREAK